jgi:CHAD domain-containing protein
MNSGLISAVGSLHPGEPADFRLRIQAWRSLLAGCGRKPGRKGVHNLRVATLRFQAALEYWLSRRQAGTPGTDEVQRWRRQGKKLRRLLGPVRQADVSLDKLAKVRSWADAEADGHPVLPKSCLEAIEEIARGVKRRRETAAKKLAAEIARRRKRLNRLSRKVEIALEGFAPATESGAADKILAQIASTAARFPTLDGENLHEFRKQIKKIRYLADVFAPSDAAAAHQAAALKRMTGAVGEWHDWQALTEEAARADRGDAAMAAAAEFLQAQAGRSLEHALKLCRQSMTRLLKPAASGDLQSEPAQEAVDRAPRKPVLNDSPPVHRATAERLARVS